MKKETSDKLLTKVASLDKSARILAEIVASADIQKRADSLTKEAGALSDYWATMLTGNIPYGIPNSVGGTIGMFQSPATEEDEAAMDKSVAKGFIPGVGMNRLQRRMKAQLKDDEGGTKHYWSQQFGPLTSTLGVAGLGAGLGAGVGKLTGAGTGKGAIAGLYGGLGLAGTAGLVAAIKAAVDRRRSKEEQKAYANSSTVKEWLLPGASQYGAWKTLGRSVGDSKERDAKQKEQEAAAEKKEASAKALVNGILAKYLNK
jgi:hypothetical protein